MGFLMLEIKPKIRYKVRKSRLPLFALTDLADTTDGVLLVRNYHGFIYTLRSLASWYS